MMGTHVGGKKDVLKQKARELSGPKLAMAATLEKTAKGSLENCLNPFVLSDLKTFQRVG